MNPPSSSPDAVAFFDRYAAGYDDVALSALGRELRGRVHAVVTPLLSADQSVVDLGCGSGIDTQWLAGRVELVQAFDQSPAMVATARRRCADCTNVTVAVADAAQVELAGPVDLVLANFGVVNCLDLGSIRSRLAAMVRIGGHLVVVTMTRWCPIELALGVATANRPLLRRRLKSSGDGGIGLQYRSARAVARELAASFTPLHAEALGIALPPFEQRGWVEHRPRLLRVLAATDRRLGALGARLALGDHHIVVLRRCDP